MSGREFEKTKTQNQTLDTTLCITPSNRNQFANRDLFQTRGYQDILNFHSYSQPTSCWSTEKN
jgi:hypothetical protein